MVRDFEEGQSFSQKPLLLEGKRGGEGKWPDWRKKKPSAQPRKPSAGDKLRE
jgi:hypothetical protein